MGLWNETERIKQTVYESREIWVNLNVSSERWFTRNFNPHKWWRMQIHNWAEHEHSHFVIDTTNHSNTICPCAPKRTHTLSPPPSIFVCSLSVCLNNNLRLIVFNFPMNCVCATYYIILLIIQLNNFHWIEWFLLEEHSHIHTHTHTLSTTIAVCVWVCIYGIIVCVQRIHIAISLCLKKLKWKD